MNDQEILENVPEGATHVDEYGVFLNTENDSYWKETRLKWVELTELVLERNTRLLADIARIAELEKDTAFLQSCVNSGETATKADRPSNQAEALREQGE